MATRGKPLAGKTITIPVFVRAEPMRSYGAIYTGVDGFDLRASASAAQRIDGDFLLARAEVTFTVPADFDPVAPMVSSIEAEKAKITAEFTARVSKLNRRLSELQAIEHTPEAA